MTSRALTEIWWPIDRLGDAVEWMSVSAGSQSPPRDATAHVDWPEVPEGREATWLVWVGQQLGVEALPVTVSIRDLATLLGHGGPAILLANLRGQRGFLALLGARRGDPLFLRPDRSRLRFRRSEAMRLLAGGHEAAVRPEVERVLDIAEISPRRRQRVADAMVTERIASEEIDGIYLLRLPASASFARQLWNAGIPMRLAQFVGLFILLYGAEIWGWSLIGGSTLSGRLDWGWLLAWLLLLFSMLPLRLLAGWNEATFAMDTGRMIKSRLLSGALRLPADAVKRSGVGQLIGQVMESQALEGLALGGGFAILVGAIELGFAAWVLNEGAAPGAHLLLLGILVVLTAVFGWRFHQRIIAWTTQRLGMTHYLIEAMVGHRTRLAQDRAARREANEDGQLSTYFACSTAMDRSTLQLGAGLLTAWSTASLLALAPALGVAAGPSPVHLAISVGGIMIAQRALGGMAAGLASLSRAGYAWNRIATIFHAGLGPTSGGILSVGNAHGNRSDPVIEARGLHYAYDRRGGAVIAGASVTVARGDRILIEGPSGGGKSTLAGLLTGLKRPDGGLLLLNGLDRPTIGDDWHSHVTAAPQFHENHILSGTLAFNLLMGRQWPASEADLAEAESLCEELGLGDLLRRMPGGIHQRVGETGWQLSHGERSRIFLARALLQQADVTILDESFASLDPATMQQCLATALDKAETLIVIAHP
ncbi:ATP-binding cassette domain-containing protein [Sphingobium subterraneum]|uniref:ATP-binding cassette subfamily B protein n=1 Tax=Sphingobium subterraneum TaxID=627688 RepID=A0A841J3W9_9SPHN|nr:ATP-binding cassette domain-containing protein [Sphingobium subterraneum]MBB6125032.1 ATP-binding cassette subfamily B protein [Sphingobium subterraneum]